MLKTRANIVYNSYLYAIYFGVILENEKTAPTVPPTFDSAITQHTPNNSGTRTRCHNYDIYRRPSPSPHQHSGPDIRSITCNMSQMDTVHMVYIRSAYLL